METLASGPSEDLQGTYHSTLSNLIRSQDSWTGSQGKDSGLRCQQRVPEAGAEFAVQTFAWLVFAGVNEDLS